MDTAPITREQSAPGTSGDRAVSEPGAAGDQADARAEQGQHARTAAGRGADACSRGGGFHGASVEEIASEAGFSTGALYSNFDGKEDLFLALMEREIDAHAREISAAVANAHSVAERATGGARQWMTMIEREPELLLLFMEFWAYGVRDPPVRPKVAARFAQMRELLTRLIADGMREFELELDTPRRAAGARDRRAR